MARLFRHLRDAFGVARARPVDQAQASIHRLAAMETRTHPLCGTAPPRRGARLGGANRRQPPRPLAAQQQSGAEHRSIKRLLPQWPRPRLRRRKRNRIINRTAVYGPVCTVVWEGRGREASPYPDSLSGLRVSAIRRESARILVDHDAASIGSKPLTLKGGILAGHKSSFPCNANRPLSELAAANSESGSATPLF